MVLSGVNNDVTIEESLEVHDSLVGFAKGYEDSYEYKFIEAFRREDMLVKAYAGRVIGVSSDISKVLYGNEKRSPQAEAENQLRLDFT